MTELSEFPFQSVEGDQVAISKRNDPVLGPILSTADGREWVEKHNTPHVYEPIDGQKYVAETAAAIPDADESEGEEESSDA